MTIYAPTNKPPETIQCFYYIKSMSNPGFVPLVFFYDKVTKMFVIKMSFATNRAGNLWNRFFLLTREGRCG